jgi:hypothetical protein
MAGVQVSACACQMASGVSQHRLTTPYSQTNGAPPLATRLAIRFHSA